MNKIDPKEAYKLLQDDEIKILDVRTPEEFIEEHIEGAININYYSADFEKRIDALDKDDSYVVHCASSGRAIETIGMMEQKGFKKLQHLEGDITKWESDGFPLAY